MVNFKQQQNISKIYICFGEFLFLFICFSIYPFIHYQVLTISDTVSNMTPLITKILHSSSKLGR